MSPIKLYQFCFHILTAATPFMEVKRFKGLWVSLVGKPSATPNHHPPCLFTKFHKIHLQYFRNSANRQIQKHSMRVKQTEPIST